MLKGHTKVELFDALTGKKQEEVEKDNLVTNAVQYALALSDRAGQDPHQYLTPLAKQGLGGILLFDGTLEEDVNNMAFPGNVHLVGHADRTTNSDEVLRGSLNSLETHRTATGYVSVWDFSTSQANGTIKSIALTNSRVGANPFRRITYCGPDDSVPFEEESKRGVEAVYMVDDYVYFVDRKKMQIIRMRTRTYSLGVADGVYSDHGLPYEVVAPLELPAIEGLSDNIQSYNILPDSKGNFYVITINNEMTKSGDSKYYYFLYGNSSKDATISLTKYHITHGKKATVEKGSDGALATLPGVHFHSIDNDYTVKIAGHYLYIRDYNEKDVYIIDVDNLVDVRKITMNNNSATALYSGIIDGAVWYSHGSYGSILYEDGSIVEEPISSMGGVPTYQVLDGKVGGAYITTYGSALACRIGMVSYLGTINNLQKPIKKTASQTMKITYTLTDASAEEA